jgi:replicative DNA helicase
MTAEDFYVPNHQELYNVITEEWQARRPIDLITLTQKLSDKGLLKQLGGAGAITSIYNFVPSSTNLDYYIEIIKNKTIARKTIQYCSEAIEKVRQAPDEMKDTLTNVQSGIGLIRPFYITQQRTFKDDVADKVERMQSGEPSADIVHTRITKLDHMSPLRLGDMVVIAGKRKSGKSILAITLEENILMTSDSAVLHFSLEDRRPKVVDRIFCWCVSHTHGCPPREGHDRAADEESNRHSYQTRSI